MGICEGSEAEEVLAGEGSMSLMGRVCEVEGGEVGIVEGVHEGVEGVLRG